MPPEKVDAYETETTSLTRQQLGAFIRKELQASSTKSVEVYTKGKREFTRRWVISFDYSKNNIMKL